MRDSRRGRRDGRRAAVTGGLAAGVALMLVGVSVVGCGGPTCDSGPGPDVCAVEAAIGAVEAEVGAETEFFEIAAYADSVRLVVKTDTGATSYEFADSKLTPGEDLPGASGAVFSASAVDFDPTSIFDQVRRDLDDPAISDFAITGGPGGSVVYDAKILGQKGGDLLVQLDRSGGVLGVQAD